MKRLHIIYLLLLAASIAIIVAFNYRYQIKEKALTQYQQKSLRELERFLQEEARLNKTISALEKDNLSSKTELQTLKDEREKLQAKIARLTEEKSILEKSFLALSEKFHSLDELKKAIRIAKLQKRQMDKTARIQRRLAKIALLRQMDMLALRQGNRGFIISDGRPTFPLRARVRVELERVGNLPLGE